MTNRSEYDLLLEYYDDQDNLVSFRSAVDSSSHLLAAQYNAPKQTAYITVTRNGTYVTTLQFGHREKILAVLARELSPQVATFFAESTSKDGPFVYCPLTKSVVLVKK